MLSLAVSPAETIWTLHQMYRDGATDEDISHWFKSVESSDNGFSHNSAQLRALREDFEKAKKSDRVAKSEKVQEWFKLNPQLPQPSLELVNQFMWASNDDVEKCKKRLNLFYSLRGTDDEIFGNRDPTSPAARQIQKATTYVSLPIRTKEFYRIIISNLLDFDSNPFDYQEWGRQMFYLIDLSFEEDLSLGEIAIFDYKGGSVPLKTKQIHFINCPPYIGKFMNIIKPLMKEKMASRIHIHTDSLDELYKFVPRELLPTEYGGTLGPLSEVKEWWVKKFEDSREWFINEEKNVKRIYQEARKNGKQFIGSGELFGMEGSFKKLDID